MQPPVPPGAPDLSPNRHCLLAICHRPITHAAATWAILYSADYGSSGQVSLCFLWVPHWAAPPDSPGTWPVARVWREVQQEEEEALLKEQDELDQHRTQHGGKGDERYQVLDGEAGSTYTAAGCRQPEMARSLMPPKTMASQAPQPCVEGVSLSEAMARRGRKPTSRSTTGVSSTIQRAWPIAR